ncbi:MAG: sulfotransferase [Pseudomonadota bacterium]
MSSQKHGANGTSGPILLFGMPRSGTTWIGKIFDSSPDTLYRHEPDSWGSLNALPLLPDSAEAEQYRQAVESFLARLPMSRRTKVAASLPIFQKAGESRLMWRLRSAGQFGIKALSNYVGEISIPAWVDGPRRKLRPVWKSIESTGRLGVLLAIAPQARAIHIVRHPCGFVASVLRGELKNKFESGKDSEDFGLFELLCRTPQAARQGIVVERLRAMTPAERLAWRWRLVNEKAMEDCRTLAAYRTVAYDQVCERPVEESEALFAFAGLEMQAQTRQFLSMSTRHENAAYYSVFKDPLKSANKWRSELAREDIDGVMRVVGDSPLMDLFNH